MCLPGGGGACLEGGGGEGEGGCLPGGGGVPAWRGGGVPAWRGGAWSGTPPPPLLTESQTRVKTLPWPKLRFGR